MRKRWVCLEELSLETLTSNTIYKLRIEVVKEETMKKKSCEELYFCTLVKCMVDVQTCDAIRAKMAINGSM